MLIQGHGVGMASERAWMLTGEPEADPTVFRRRQEQIKKQKDSAHGRMATLALPVLLQRQVDYDVSVAKLC